MAKQFDPFGHYEMLIIYDGDDSDLSYSCSIYVSDKVGHDGEVFFSALGNTPDDVLIKAERFIAQERLKKIQENKKEYLK